MMGPCLWDGAIGGRVDWLGWGMLLVATALPLRLGLVDTMLTNCGQAFF